MEPSRIVEKPESGASESHQEAGVSPVNQKTEVQMASKVGRAKQSIEGGEASSKAQPFHSDPDESERASAPGGAKSSQIKEKSESNVAGESDSPQKVGASSVDHKTKVQMVTKVGRAERSVEGGETPTKAQPFDTDSNESRGASAPDGATKQSIEREASSKAQPFHSDPDESERASSLGGATERSVEGGVRPSKDQTFDTDSNESLGASAPDGASDIRIEDAFAEIARKFTSFIHFKMFALSGNGLRLSAGEVSTIIADNPDSVEDKKFGMLDLWKEKNGTRASPTHIAEIIQQYFRQERGGVTGSRIEDAFLAVPKVFDNAALFQRFALSGKGLSLSMHEVGNIKENAKNVEERNLDLLVLWKLKTGDSATTEKIWQLANAFLDERGESHPDQPPLHPRPMELPVAEERAGDAEPLRPDAEPSQADPRPVRQEPAERFAEEGEASSKAQPFHSDESEGALSPGGAIQISSEVSAVLGSQGAGKPVSVSFPKGKFDRAHFGDQHIATQNITNYYGPVVNQDSAQQKRTDAPGAIKAAVGLGEDDEKVQIFKKEINDLTRKNAQPASTIGCLTTPKIKIQPRTVDVDFYGSAAKDAEYKPELGFSQHTQKATWQRNIHGKLFFGWQIESCSSRGSRIWQNRNV
uniref:uncharacterized protein LOC120331185 isoform X2 n=1 Tax=Styela clava TaxID=7725 RepID=UPI00193AA2AA|nr:uncharacterized protein LOC120331185 isoform X2 [Styela clava]